MTDPTLTSSPERQAIPPRRTTAIWLALLALTLAVPLVGDLAAVAQDPRRGLVAINGATLWAIALVVLMVGPIVALAVRPARWRLGLAWGLGLAVLGAGTAVILQQGRVPVPLGESRCQLPTVEPVTSQFHLSAETAVDGQRRGSLMLQIRSHSAGDEPLLAGLLSELKLAAVEDVGQERFGSAPVKHCRALVSGSQVTAALPALATGDGDEPLVPADLPVWRGDFDWWISDWGELVVATFRVGGHPNDAWPEADGQQGLLTVELLPVSPRLAP